MRPSCGREQRAGLGDSGGSRGRPPCRYPAASEDRVAPKGLTRRPDYFVCGSSQTDQNLERPSPMWVAGPACSMR